VAQGGRADAQAGGRGGDSGGGHGGLEPAQPTPACRAVRDRAADVAEALVAGFGGAAGAGDILLGQRAGVGRFGAELAGHGDAVLERDPGEEPALGSVRGIVSNSGNLTATTSYDAWGNPQSPGGLAAYTPFGYAGGYTDPTGLVYLIHRYYDPATGQFLSVGPDVSQTGEPYAYGGGDPVINADPMGLWITPVPCADCAWDDEFEFRDTVGALLAAMAIVQGGVTVSKEVPMDTPLSDQLRIVDLYWDNLRADYGWMNEFKIGRVYWTGNVPKEARNDKEMLRVGFALGAGMNNRGEYYPVSDAIWWFGANRWGQINQSGQLIGYLLAANINVVEVVPVPGAPRWPRKQSKQVENEEREEIESGDEGEAQAGLYEMFGDPLVCVQP